MGNVARPRAGIRGLESRSIDYVPPEERHGVAWHQGPFWFTGGFVLPSMLIGFIGPGLGLGLGWSLLRRGRRHGVRHACSWRCTPTRAPGSGCRR